MSVGGFCLDWLTGRIGVWIVFVHLCWDVRSTRSTSRVQNIVCVWEKLPLFYTLLYNFGRRQVWGFLSNRWARFVECKLSSCAAYKVFVDLNIVCPTTIAKCSSMPKFPVAQCCCVCVCVCACVCVVATHVYESCVCVCLVTCSSKPITGLLVTLLPQLTCAHSLISCAIWYQHQLIPSPRTVSITSDTVHTVIPATYVICDTHTHSTWHIYYTWLVCKVEY